MRNAIASMVAAVAVAVALGFAVTGAAHAQEELCLDKREIQERINSGQLRQLSEAIAAAGVEGKIISSAVQLCRIDGRWQWRVNVMDYSGESKPVTLPAE